MNVSRALIAWTPADEAGEPFGRTAGRVAVGPWPNWSAPYKLRVGACDAAWSHAASEQEPTVLMFAAFHGLVIRDGLDPRAADLAFSAIKEFRALTRAPMGLGSKLIARGGDFISEEDYLIRRFVLFHHHILREGATPWAAHQALMRFPAFRKLVRDRLMTA